VNPLFLIVEDHRIHKAKRVKRYVESRDGKLERFYRPPCSLHLNPDETVRPPLKRRVLRQWQGVKRAETLKP